MISNTRRKFLASISAVTAGAGLVSLTPQAPQFLCQSAAWGADQPTGETILVVIQLSGGNDGLNTVVPFADDRYRKARPSLALASADVLKIDRQTGLHRSLVGFEKLLQKNQLAILQGVGYPNPNRSHFESMDIWHSARLEPRERTSGWLGRALDECRLAGQSPSDPLALHLGSEVQPLALTARVTAVPSIRSLDQFRLNTGGDPAQGSAIGKATASPRAGASDLLQFVQTRATAALEVSRRLAESGAEYKSAVSYPETGLGQKLKQVARLIDAGLRSRIFYVALDGFDTHSDQEPAHGGLLRELDGAVSAFTADLEARGAKDRVATLVFSEFGRRVAENASRGTDHGAAAPAFVIGSRVKAGLIGPNPRLDDLDDGDVKFQTDFRSVYAALLDHWLGWRPEPILGASFTPVPVFTG